MFETGTLVMHETAGVCRVNGTVKLDKMPGEYYNLSPIYSKGSTIYSPKNGQRVMLRPVMSRDEANALIDQFSDVELLSFHSPTEQKQISSDILKSGDSLRLAQLGKTIYTSQCRRYRAGKKVAAAERDMAKRIERILFGELAISLNIGIDQVEDYISQRLEENKAASL